MTMLKHHINVWRETWKRRHELKSEKRSPHELEFLPAALEVQDTPPSPLGRVVAWSLIALFSLAAIWASVGKVDIVAVAQGKIIPAGRSKVVQPLESGVVSRIHVKDGQRVKRGDPLIDLDSAIPEADLESLKSRLMTARAAQARVEELLNWVNANDEIGMPALNAPAEVTPSIVRIQRALMLNQHAEYRASEKALIKEIDRQRAERAALGEELKKLEAIIPLISRRTESLKQLAAQKLAAEHDYLELEQQRIEHVQDRAMLKRRLDETDSAIEKARAQRASHQAEFKSTLIVEQAELDASVAALRQELIKTKTRAALRRLTAPVDGFVQQLAVHTIGGVVSPAQTLLVIVPDEHPLEVEAWIQNKDIGFIQDNQKVEIKIDAFPFTKYGTIDGEIVDVSNDAVEAQDLGWVFTTRVKMLKSTIAIVDRTINLTPGMSVSVEVKTGKRRIIEFFLSPLLRYTQESARER